MSRLLITGMSGAGKSTLLEELERRGHRTVDTDYGGWTAGSGGPSPIETPTYRPILIKGTPIETLADGALLPE